MFIKPYRFLIEKRDCFLSLFSIRNLYGFINEHVYLKQFYSWRIPESQPKVIYFILLTNCIDVAIFTFSDVYSSIDWSGNALWFRTRGSSYSNWIYQLCVYIYIQYILLDIHYIYSMYIIEYIVYILNVIEYISLFVST